MAEPGEILKTAFERRPVFWSLIAGIFLGILLLAPYLILSYSLFWFIETGEIGLYRPVAIEGERVFRFFVLSISFSFVSFGCLIGFTFGKWYVRKQKHIEEQIEHEKKKAAIETLRELNVTLSHYIINSSSIIRGFAERGHKKSEDEKMKEYFAIIQEEADKAIAVMKGLSALKDLESIKYIESGTTMMVDLKKQLAEQMAKLEFVRRKHLEPL